MTSTWAYVFTYRIHGPSNTYAEPSGTAYGFTAPLTEFQLQDEVRDNFLLSQDARDNGWDASNTVITRFHYTEIECGPVPDVSQDGVPGQTERQDTDEV